MLKNNFKMNTQRKEINIFSNRFGMLLSFSLVLSGLFCLSGLFLFMNGAWHDLSDISLAWKSLVYLCVFCCFVAFIKIALDEKSFSRVLSFCIQLIGILWIMSSILFPRLNGYQFSGFAIFKYNDFILIDGMILMIGMMILIFGFLLKDGYQMQKQIDEMI